MAKKKDDAPVTRINVRVSPEALDRLNYACELREAAEQIGKVPQARVVNEQLLKLPARPAVQAEPVPAKRKGVKAEQPITLRAAV